MLGHPTSKGSSRTFSMAAGTFTTDKFFHLTNAMFPFLSMNQTFSIELMVMPKKFSSDPNYGVIIGEESMRLLNLDTSVQDNMILGVKNKSQWSLMTTGQQNASSITNHD